VSEVGESRVPVAERVRSSIRLPPQAAPAIVAFAIAAVGMLIVALLQGPKLFYYDSGMYWGLGGSFVHSGHFSLLNFDSPLRGYLLPLVNHGLHGIAGGLGWNDSSLAKLFNVAIFALIATVLAPRLAALAWPERRWGLWRRVALAALLVVFWGGYLNFPLSDFPALAAVLLALIAVSRPDAPGWMLLAGAAAAAAIDMRPAYLLVAPVLAVLVALAWWEQRGRPHASLARRALCAGLLLLGFAVISLPQSLATHRHYNTWSFVPGSAAGLSQLQYTEGTRLQRYDTYVGVGKPSPQMFYLDDTGARLLRDQEGGTIRTTRQFLGLVLSHPAMMGGLFARHVVNGLDQRYNTPYIDHLETGSHRWMRLAGFLVVFLALARVAWPAARRRLGAARWRYPVALLVCGLTSIASAVETRFLLPAYLLSYVMLLTPGWPNPFGAVEGRRRFAAPALLVAAFVVFMAVVLHVIGSATEHLHFG
jgi:hypothetical protein